MKEYTLPRWGWWVQIASSVGLNVIFLVAIFSDTAKDKAPALEYAVAILFILLAMAIIYDHWYHWPYKIVIAEDDTVTFYTHGSVTAMPITDINAAQYGSGIWLYHAKGKFTFDASPTDQTLSVFFHEVSKRNPNFIDGSLSMRPRRRRRINLRRG